AGAMTNALDEAESLGLDTVQVFTKNQRQWKVKPLDGEARDAWNARIDELGWAGRTVAHDSYLINLASPDPALRSKSIDLFVEEVRRCGQLGIGFLVTHPGAHMGEGEPAGLRRVAEALDDVHARTPEAAGHVLTCLESTAGQGTSLGYKLEHLAEILSLVKHPERLGVCLDTAHLFAAGYDLRGDGYAAFRKQLARLFGVKQVKVWHLNDSKKPLGSRVDRHAHIGHGEIGLEGFRGIVNDSAWAKVPKILETPKETDDAGRAWDAVNLETLQSLKAS
ncbi:MAG: deoxyribonuclease IV, partial [Phycisphaerae bacterium]